MASESLAEDQCESSLSNVVLHTGGKSGQPNDQFASGDDYAPKVRKPYTITKQRERWTEEEHKKFLEALKLYGRAWRRIEEHVGTKTAVQIRSHAQKFFSKVVRESSDANEVKPIEIPPPRPKRKPMHPYPRKMATTPVKTGGGATHILLEQRPNRSASPNSSGSDQENQSPTSVLSAVGSDTFSPNGCSSPASSAAGVKPSSEPDLAPDETENGSSSPVEENESSTPINQVPVKLESSWEDKEFVKEGSSEAASSTQSLKLFGKTVLITDSHRPSSPTSGTCKSLDQSNSNFGWSGNLPCGAPVYYMEFLSENLDPAPVAAASPATPMWSLYGGFSVSYPFLQLHNPAPVKEAGSERNCDFNTQSETKKASLFRPSKGSAFSEPKSSMKGKCVKGFVPYKRCLAERDASSSMVTGEEREEQRIRLCL